MRENDFNHLNLAARLSTKDLRVRQDTANNLASPFPQNSQSVAWVKQHQ